MFRGRLLPLFFRLGRVQGRGRVVEVRVVLALCIYTAREATRGHCLEHDSQLAGIRRTVGTSARPVLCVDWAVDAEDLDPQHAQDALLADAQRGIPTTSKKALTTTTTMMMMITMLCINLLAYLLTCLSLMFLLACLLAAFSEVLTSLAESTAHRDYFMRAPVDYCANRKIIAEYLHCCNKCLKRKIL